VGVRISTYEFGERHIQSFATTADRNNGEEKDSKSLQKSLVPGGLSPGSKKADW